MTADEFRNLALSMPEATESAHMDHPDFRVRGKIFATLGHPEDGWGMVKLTPAQQAEFVAREPRVFQPVPGGWGHQGATHVRTGGHGGDGGNGATRPNRGVAQRSAEAARARVRGRVRAGRLLPISHKSRHPDPTHGTSIP